MRKTISSIIVLMVLFSVCSSAYALNVQRKLFQAAEQALNENNQAHFEALKIGLSDYPLYPYLLYQGLQQRLKSATSKEVEDFLDRYQSLLVAQKLRKDWLLSLAEQKRWSTFLKHYPANADASLGTNLDCLHRQALWHTDRRREALKNIDKLWLVGKSQPDNCNLLFKAWRKRGGFTKERVWQRFTMAMANRQVKLGRYLSSLMIKRDLNDAQLWLDVIEKPQRVLDKKRFRAKSSRTQEIILSGLWHWSRKDSVSAAQAG